MTEQPKFNKISGGQLAGGNSRFGRADNDFYATPASCTEKLLEKEDFSGTVLEPCCGQGHISKVLERAGLDVTSNDLINRGYGTSFKDFLNDDFATYDNVITNPPFKYAKEFIEKSLKITNKKVAMFCKLQLLEGVSRREMFKNAPLKTVYVFTKRQNPMRNGEEVSPDGKKWAGTMCFAWFVFEKGYQGQPTIDWID